MANESTILRFKVGSTYALSVSDDLPQALAGTMRVLFEIMPSDVWGNRILCCSCSIMENGCLINIPAAKVFVEEGYCDGGSEYGGMVVPCEIATLMGIEPRIAKAYAIDIVEP